MLRLAVRVPPVMPRTGPVSCCCWAANQLKICSSEVWLSEYSRILSFAFASSTMRNSCPIGTLTSANLYLAEVWLEVRGLELEVGTWQRRCLYVPELQVMTLHQLGAHKVG